jgi:hypothetical protein
VFASTGTSTLSLTHPFFGYRLLHLLQSQWWGLEVSYLHQQLILRRYFLIASDLSSTFQDGCKDCLAWENILYFHFSNSYKISLCFLGFLWNGENKIIKKSKMFFYFSNQIDPKICLFKYFTVRHFHLYSRSQRDEKLLEGIVCKVSLV